MSKIDFFVSPNYSPEKLDSNDILDFVDVFEDRMICWIFNPVEALLEMPEGHIAAFGILTTYFESIQIYKKGTDSKSKSKEFFINCFCEVFAPKDDCDSTNSMKNAATAFYIQGRCGFAHDGLFKNKVFFSDSNPNAMIFSYPLTNGKVDTSKALESIVVNPFRFAGLIYNHFQRYLTQLRDSNQEDARRNFMNAVKLKWGLDEPDAVIGMTENDFLFGDI